MKKQKQLTVSLALLAALLLTVPAYADAIMPGPGEVALAPGGSGGRRHRVPATKILDKEKVRCFT